MATSYPPEDDVSCTLCLEIYDEPHVLDACNHTFCLKCLEPHEEGGEVQCPLCRQKTDKSRIKLDLNTKERCLTYKTNEAILELEKVKGEIKESTDSPDENSDETTGSDQEEEEDRQEEESAYLRGRTPPHCTMCDIKANKAKAHCGECGVFLCKTCIIRHGNIPVCKDHKLSTVQEVVQLCEARLVNMMNELLEVRKEVTDHSSSIDQTMRNLQITQAKQLDFIHQTTKESMRQLEEETNQMQQNIRDSSAAAIGKLREQMAMNDKNKQDLQANIEYLTEAVKSQDIKKLHKALNQAEAPEVQEMMKRIEELNHEAVELPIVVQRSKDWDVKNIIDVKIDHSDTDSVEKN